MPHGKITKRKDMDEVVKNLKKKQIKREKEKDEKRKAKKAEHIRLRNKSILGNSVNDFNAVQGLQEAVPRIGVRKFNNIKKEQQAKILQNVSGHVMDHVFLGQKNKSGRGTGFHSYAVNTPNVVTQPNQNSSITDVFEQGNIMFTDENRIFPKNNNGKSTLFPMNQDVEDVMEIINEACWTMQKVSTQGGNNQQYGDATDSDGQYEGYCDINGRRIYVQMWIRNGEMQTAYPVLVPKLKW